MSDVDDGGLTNRIARDQAVYQAAQDLFLRHEAVFTGHNLADADANQKKATAFNLGVGVPSNLDIKCMFAECSNIKSYQIGRAS